MSLKNSDIFKRLFWVFVLAASLISAMLAGHLQFFSYSLLILITYIVFRFRELKDSKTYSLLLLGASFLLMVIVTFVQWYPTGQFVLNSTRNYDQANFAKEGWFIPWQNAVQFIAPDFFGNPSTGNYYGIWNYAEFVGFIGIIPLFFAFYAVLFGKNKNRFYFLGILVTSIIFAFPNPIAQIPYSLNLPFITSSQPTRLIFCMVFALCIMSAYGMDQSVKEKNNRKSLVCLSVTLFLLLILWIYIFAAKFFHINISLENLAISKRNLIFPSMIVFLSVPVIYLSIKFRFGRYKILGIILFVLVIADLFRFSYKFLPFSSKEWLYPDTKITQFLQKNIGSNRVMAVDRRIMPPDFSVAYKLQDVSGYDPLYLQNYGELVASWERNKSDISNFSFNRILTPSNTDSFITDFLGVQYVLSINEQKAEKLSLLISEGQTKLYKNRNTFPRAFFVEEVVSVNNRQEEINKFFNLGNDLRKTAIIRENFSIMKKPLDSNEMVNIDSYQADSVIISAECGIERMLVLTDIYYPTWKAYIDEKETRIYQVDFTFRGIVVPKGKHKIEFINSLI